MTQGIGDCDTWHFLGWREWQRWSSEECRDDRDRDIVLEFLQGLKADPLAVQGSRLGLHFQVVSLNFLKEPQQWLPGLSLQRSV